MTLQMMNFVNSAIVSDSILLDLLCTSLEMVDTIVEALIGFRQFGVF